MLTVLLCLWGTGAAQAAYDPPLDKVLIYLDTEGGLSAPVNEMARVPLFLLYKNGDLLYSFYDEGVGTTKLMKAHIEEKAITHLMSIIREKEFSEWNEYYENCPLTDVPTTKLYIELDGEAKTVNIWGIDYAVKNKTIPQGLIEVYRKLTCYSLPEAKEYEPEKIVLYVKRVPEEPRGLGVKIHKWRQKFDLAPLSEEANFSGFGSVLLDGKEAKSVYNDLKDKAPFSKKDMAVFFKQGRNFYTLGYRPLLLHEVERKENEGKKGKAKKEEKE